MLATLLKFRGKDKDDNWVIGREICNTITEEGDIISCIMGIIGMNRMVSKQVVPDTVGLYSGIKGTSDKEIFSGDIIQWHSRQIIYEENKLDWDTMPSEEYRFVSQQGVVVYDEEYAAFMVVNKQNKVYYLGDINKECNLDFFKDTSDNYIYQNIYKEDYPNYHGITVLGNIFDNKELIP